MLQKGNIGIDVNLVNQSGSTALIWSSSNSHNEIVCLLLENNADVNRSGDTAQKWANFIVTNEIIRLLCKK